MSLLSDRIRKTLFRTRKYLLIHIPKNGGMTIRQSPHLKDKVVLARRKLLKSRQYANAVLQTMTALGNHPGYEHARLRDVKMAARRTYRPFAVVRNPWARVVSRFLFARRSRGNGEDLTFEAFLEERHIWGGKDLLWHRPIKGWYPQLDYVVDEGGRIAVDLLRLEHLEAELRRYLDLGELSFERRNVSRSGVAGYKDWYDARTIQIVADWYAADIETFGFDFDTPARRNVLYADG